MIYKKQLLSFLCIALIICSYSQKLKFNPTIIINKYNKVYLYSPLSDSLLIYHRKNSFQTIDIGQYQLKFDYFNMYYEDEIIAYNSQHNEVYQLDTNFQVLKKHSITDHTYDISSKIEILRSKIFFINNNKNKIYVLKNENLDLLIDLPHKITNFTIFDNKIVTISESDIAFYTPEGIFIKTINNHNNGNNIYSIGKHLAIQSKNHIWIYDTSMKLYLEYILKNDQKLILINNLPFQINNQELIKVGKRWKMK